MAEPTLLLRVSEILKLISVSSLFLLYKRKCHKEGQLILMYDGSLCKVEDLKVGDQIMGPDGTVRNILDTSQGFGEMFEIQPSCGGNRWQVNAEHMLTLENVKTRWEIP